METFYHLTATLEAAAQVSSMSTNQMQIHMIPEPQFRYIESGHEFLIPMGISKLRDFIPTVEGMNIVESRRLIPEPYRAIQEAITEHEERIAIGDGFIVRNPDDKHKELPFVVCSLYEATVWTFLSLTWGMKFAHQMFLSRYPLCYQSKWATCPWCSCEFAELAHPDSTLCDGMCSSQCYDQDYEARHSPEPEPTHCDCLGGYCEGQCAYSYANYYEPEPEPELTPLNSVFLVQSYDLEAYNSPMETLGVANSAAEAEAMALRYIEQSQYGRIKLVPRTSLNEYHSGFNHLLYIEEVQMNSLLSQPN